MDCLSKAARSEQSWPKREVMGSATTNSAVGAELPKPFGVHILPQTASAGEHRTVGYIVFPAGFCTCLGPIPLYPPIYTFWNGNVYLVLSYVETV